MLVTVALTMLSDVIVQFDPRLSSGGQLEK